MLIITLNNVLSARKSETFAQRGRISGEWVIRIGRSLKIRLKFI